MSDFLKRFNAASPGAKARMLEEYAAELNAGGVDKLARELVMTQVAVLQVTEIVDRLVAVIEKEREP